MKDYLRTLNALLGSPKSFFSSLSPGQRIRAPFLFLLFSALFHTGASMTLLSGHRVALALVILANAVFMPLAAAGAGFLVSRMSSRKSASFPDLYAVYAYSSGVTLLASWIPLFAWITEPWKWILIMLGLRKGLGLGRFQTMVVFAGSLGMVALFFYSLSSALLAVKASLP